MILSGPIDRPPDATPMKPSSRRPRPTVPLSLLLAAHALTLVACGGARPAGDEMPADATPRAVETPPTMPPSLEDQQSGTTVLLQAVSVVDSNVVWVSGHEGTWARTLDGGRSWTAARVPGADTLQFRDVHASSARTAWLLAAGPADMSRIYRTDDGGTTWSLQWTNREADGFYDCLDFWDDRRGIAYGDAIDGQLRVLRTEDGGANWRLVPAASLPAAQVGEGGFAASGTCVATRRGGLAWIAAGNAARARAFLTSDYGLTWSAVDVPVVGGDAAGLTSISMVDASAGTAFGGALSVGDRRTENVARTTDGGRTWAPMPHIAFNGAIYGGLHVPGTAGHALLAVGPGGLAASLDGANSWSMVDTRAWWGIGSAGRGASWVTGPQGRIARLRFEN